MDEKIIFLIWHTVYSHRFEQDLSDEIIRIPNFHFSRKLWWNNCWKLPKLLRRRKVHSFHTIKNIDIRLGHNKKENILYDRIPLKRIIALWVNISLYLMTNCSLKKGKKNCFTSSPNCLIPKAIRPNHKKKDHFASLHI